MDELISRLVWEVENWYLNLPVSGAWTDAEFRLAQAFEAILEERKNVAREGVRIIRETPDSDLLERPYYVPHD